MNEQRLLFLTKKANGREYMTDDEVKEWEILKSQMQEMLKDNLDKISPLTRETIEKRYLQGKEWATIADEMLDLSSDAPRKRAKRALKRVYH